jgi:tetratricopeptide (TPR) repeat protein
MLPGWWLLLMFQSATPPVRASPQSRAQASVLLVRGRIAGIHGQQGSGVVIAPNLVATNAHVVEGTQEIVVQQGQRAWFAIAARMDLGHDLCLLTVPGLTAPVAVLAPPPTEPGQGVMAVGYPGGRGPVVSTGRLRGIWHLGDSLLFQSDVTTRIGSSGGGLFDEQGRLLGLTTRISTAGPRLNFSVPVAAIQALAQRSNGGEDRPEDWVPVGGGPDLLGRLAADPRNWPAWETAARQWVLDLPQDENAWLALGLALDASVRASVDTSGGTAPEVLTEGVAAYRKSLSLRREPAVWNNLGVSLDLLNRSDEAERAFNEALAMTPDYALAWLNLGCTRVNAGRYAAAEEALQKGLALRPDEANGWLRLALCQRRLGQREAAAVTMQIALRYRPLRAEWWLDFGLLLVDMARLAEAREVHGRLVSMDPALAARLQASLNRDRVIRSGAGGRKRRR